MTTTLKAVREAIADSVRETTGLRCMPYLTDQVNAPQGMIDIAGPAQVTFSDEGRQTYQFTILVFDQRTSERAAQERFDELRDPFHDRSIKRAVDDSTALAALAGVDFGNIGSPTSTTPVTIGSTDYLVVEWPLEVIIHQED